MQRKETQTHAVADAHALNLEWNLYAVLSIQPMTSFESSHDQNTPPACSIRTDFSL